MPIYEYECRECGHRFEALQKISDAPVSECPACGRDTVSKLISASGFRLKGSGWYETDFKTGTRRHGTQDSAKNETASDSGSGDKKKESKSTDGKSAA
ncbi:MAG: FmdB family zinc ribbon protein [Pseudomonadota bacterium]